MLIGLSLALTQQDLSGSGEFTPPTAGAQLQLVESGIVTSGSDVTHWNDSSGNSRHLTAGGLLPATSTLNGHVTVQFLTADGTIGTPLARGSALFSGTASTTYIVANKDSTWAESGIYTTKLSFQANHHPFSDLAIYDANFSTARKSCGAQVVAVPDNWRIFCIRSQDNDYRMHIDGQEQHVTATNLFAAGTDFVLGCGAFDGTDTLYALQGGIAEVHIYNVFDTNAQVNAMGAYLASRFARTWTPIP